MLDLGPALLQLVVSQTEHRMAAKPADVLVTLAFLAGRVVQRSCFQENPQSFRIDQSANGIAFLRSDVVSAKLIDMKTGTLAAKLVESAMLAGASRFPDFLTTRQDAHESMTRRGQCLFEQTQVSDQPEALAANVQSDVDALVANADERPILIAGLFNAAGLAISYARHRLCPAMGAELAMRAALHAAWLDQRQIGKR
jgi:hypothetical protein